MRPVSRLATIAGSVLLCGAVAACASSPSVTVSTNGASSGAASGTPSTATSSDVANGSVPSAKTVVHDARSAYASAKSAHLRAVIDVETGTETIDLKGVMDGSNQELTITYPDEGTATIRTVNSKYYIKGDRRFWQKSAGKTAADTIAGKWVEAPPSSARSFRKLTLRGFLDQLIGPATISDADLDKATTSRSTRSGNPAWFVDSHEGDTLTVSADGRNRLLQATGPTGDGDGTADLDGWDSQPRIEAPPGAITLPDGGSSGGPSGGGTDDGRTT